MEKETLDWIFLKGPLTFLIVDAIAAIIFGWKKFFRDEKDKLGTPTKVYIGESRVVGILFRINSALVVTAIFSIFVYAFLFYGWIGR